jgi:serine/threonine-protein kinase
MIYVIVEYIKGINLKERIRRIAPFGLSAAVDFGCAMAEGLHYAHGMGQAHGDLRPQNIIISPDGVLKITDFGVQLAIAASPRAQRETLQRSAFYHAPELSTTQRGTPAGDIYAMGAILFEMLTGTPLYAAESLEAIADKHAFAAIPSPRAVNPGVPRAVEGIIVKCLQKKPADRYRNVAELLNDLQAVRDALRFGKSLSWTPIDIEKASAAPTSTREAALLASNEAETVEPVAAVAASSEALAATPRRRRTVSPNERIPFWIKAAIFTVTSVIVLCILAMGGIWAYYWVEAKPLNVPELVGKPISEVRQIASSMDIRLIEHAEFSEKPRNILYKVDKNFGAQIRPKQAINVWYSKGPAYVDVPKVVGMSREEAEKKLTDAGLKLGIVLNENHEKILEGKILRQAAQRRVLHDTPIDLVVSAGPKAVPIPTEEPNPTNSGAGAENPAEHNPSAQEVTELKEFNRAVSIGADGLGMRSVRVEFEDALGTHTVVDESHDEGDRIQISFTYTGKKIKLRIYYNERLAKEFPAFDPQKTKGQVN